MKLHKSLPIFVILMTVVLLVVPIHAEEPISQPMGETGGFSGVVWVDPAYGRDKHNDGHQWGITAFSTIHSAVEAVPPGYTINVKRGIYTETLRIEKPVRILAVDGPENTVIQADGRSEVMIMVLGVRTGEVAIENFVIEGGRAGDTVVSAVSFSQSRGVLQGNVIQNVRKVHQNSAAVKVVGGSSVIIKDCDIQDYIRTGVYVGGTGTTALIDGTWIAGEMPSDPVRVQTGVQVGDGASVDIRFSEITGNDNLSPDPHSLSQGVYVMEWPAGKGASARIQNTTFFENMVGVQAGFAYDEDRSQVTMEGNTLEANRIGVLATARSSIKLTNNYFIGDIPNDEYGVLIRQPNEMDGAFHAPTLIAENNRFIDYETAIAVEDVNTDPKSSSLEVRMNYFRNCSNAAIDASNADNLVLAMNNWWGAANGPSGENDGDGERVVGRVLFEPWLENNIFAQAFIGD